MTGNRDHKRDLTDRHLKEEQFSDSGYSLKRHGAKHYNYSPTAIIFSKMKEKLGDIKNKRVLEYGCGTGWITPVLASMGGIVNSFDISQVAVDRTEQILKNNKLNENCTIKKMTAEELQYPDDAFDIVIGFAILHHLDLSRAMPELYRVMKPSGMAFFAEPLGGNPIINFYRKLTPQYRTVDETPIILKDFLSYTQKFEYVHHEEFYLTALLPFLLIYLPYLGKYFDSLVNPLMRVDNLILQKFPGLGKWAWYSIFAFRKQR